MKLWLSLLFVFLLFGCASMKPKEYVWEKPGANNQDFYMDSGQCKAQGASVPGMALMQVVIVYSNCMAGKGWYQVEVAR